MKVFLIVISIFLLTLSIVAYIAWSAKKTLIRGGVAWSAKKLPLRRNKNNLKSSLLSEIEEQSRDFLETNKNQEKE